MIDHVGLNVSDYATSKRFFERALAPLGYRGTGTHVAFPGLGPGDGGRLPRGCVGSGRLGQRPAGVREHYHPTYYAAFVRDPDS